MGNDFNLKFNDMQICEKFKKSKGAFAERANVEMNLSESAFTPIKEKNMTVDPKMSSQGSIFDADEACEVQIKDYFNSDSSTQKPADNKWKNQFDGEIGNFKQGATGDCWLLSGLKAMQEDEKGREILKNSIQYKDNGDLVITLKGGKTGINQILVTQDELKNAKNLSSGDMDVKAFEIALEKYNLAEFTQNVKDNKLIPTDIESTLKKKTAVTGGSSSEIFELLTGNGAQKEYIFKRLSSSVRDDYGFVNMNLLKQRTIEALTQYSEKGPVVLAVKSDGESDAMLPPSKKVRIGNVELSKKHAFQFAGINGQNILLRDPHDASKIVEVDIDAFVDYGVSDPKRFEIQAIDLQTPRPRIPKQQKFII